MDWREKIVSISIIGTPRNFLEALRDVKNSIKHAYPTTKYLWRVKYENRGMDNKGKIFPAGTRLRSQRSRTSRTESGRAKESFSALGQRGKWGENKKVDVVGGGEKRVRLLASLNISFYTSI